MIMFATPVIMTRLKKKKMCLLSSSFRETGKVEWDKYKLTMDVDISEKGKTMKH